MLKLSVIIPVFNASRYIERCLQSVEAQTLGEIEVLLVDDHGTDDSIAVAEAFVARSTRKDIRYRFAATPENNGPAPARNLGLQLAEGEYVAFLDADDWIEPDMCETLYVNAKGADMSCCNIMQDYEDGQPSRVLANPTMPKGKLTIATRRQLLRKFASHFTSYIYKREWLMRNGILFPETRSAEDSAFLTCCLLTANRIEQTEKALYHYVMHAGSLTRRRVWKGVDKRRAMGATMVFAKKKGVFAVYKWQLRYIYMKKALIVPIVEML